MNALDRKLGRDLLETRAVLGAILLVMVVGIACFVGLSSAYTNLERARRAYYTTCRMADFSVEMKKAPVTALARVAVVTGVAEVQPRIAFDVVIDLERAARPVSGRVISLPDRRGAVINDVVIQRGTYFTPGRPAETIVNDAFARERGIRPGQVIHVILNGRRQALHVVGTAVSSEFVYLINPGSIVPDPRNYGVLYVKRTFAEDALDFGGACNQVVGRLDPSRRGRPHVVLAEIERVLDEYGVFTTTPRSRQPSHKVLSDELAELRIMAVVLPAVFLAVAALVLNILMSRLAEQQRTTVGTLKALGYSDRTLTWHYLQFGVVVGVLGGGLGAGAGYGLAAAMTSMYRVFFQLPDLENRLVPAACGGAVVIGVAFAVVGTLRGVRAIIRLDPAAAMRPAPPARGGAIGLERFRGAWGRLDFRWQMAIRSVVRHRWRTAAGVFAATAGCALLVMTFYLMASMEELVDFQFGKILVSDLDLAFDEERGEEAVLEARRLPGVRRAEPLFVLPCEIRHGSRAKRSAIMGVVPGATLTVPRTADGTPVPVPEAGLAMSRKLAEMLGAGPGDEVTIVPVRGRRDPLRVPVTRLADSFLGLATYADYRFLNRIADQEGAVSSVQLETIPGSGPELHRALKRLPGLRAATDNAEAKASLVTLLDAMWYSIAILIGLAGAIFFGSILTTSLIAIAERRREVATLLVMGYDRRQVGGIFLRESMLVNMTGAALGLPVGFGLCVWVIAATSTELYRLPVVASPPSLLLAIGLSVAFTGAAHGFVRREMSKMNWLEALNAKE